MVHLGEVVQHMVTTSGRWAGVAGDSVYCLRTFTAPLKLNGARADLVVMATARSRAPQAGGRRRVGSSRGGSAWKDHWRVTKCLVVHAGSFTVAVVGS